MHIEHLLSARQTDDCPQAEAARFEDFLFLRPQFAHAPSGEIMHHGDFPAQFALAFNNLQALLAKAGGSLGDVVRMRYHFFDGRHYIDCRRARHAVWPSHGPPATVVIGYGLPDPHALGGLEAIAYLGDDKQVIDWSGDFAGRATVPDYAPETRGKVGFSPAARAGNVAFLAGQTALDRDDNYLFLGEPRSQTEFTHANNLRVLELVGVDSAAAAKLFHFAPYPHYFDTIHEVTQQFFPHSPPSSSIAAALGWPGNIIESEITAAVGVAPRYHARSGAVADPSVNAAVEIGDLLFTAGIAPRSPSGALVGPGDGNVQIQQAFRNLVDLLHTAGADATCVLMINVYLSATTLLPVWEETKARLWREHFPPDLPFPPYSAIAVTALPSFEDLVQIEAIAALR